MDWRKERVSRYVLKKSLRKRTSASSFFSQKVFSLAEWPSIYHVPNKEKTYCYDAKWCKIFILYYFPLLYALQAAEGQSGLKIVNEIFKNYNILLEHTFIYLCIKVFTLSIVMSHYPEWYRHISITIILYYYRFIIVENVQISHWNIPNSAIIIVIAIVRL